MTTKERQKLYYQNNKDKWHKYYAIAKETDPLFYEKRLKSVKESYRRTRDRVLDKYGSRCNNKNCRWLNEDGTLGCSDRTILQIDHVYGCGHWERKKTKSKAFLNKVSADTKGLYQLLCPNCNWLKKVNSKIESSSIHTPILREKAQRAAAA